MAGRILACSLLALLCGLGIVYVPELAFVAVAGILVLGVVLMMPARGLRQADRSPAPTKAAGKPRSTRATKLVSGYLLIWWLALLTPIVMFSERGATSDITAQAAASGSLQNQVLFGSFGLVGAAFVPTAIRRFDPAFRWVALLWGMYLCWGFLSLAWSAYPPLTFRNVAAFVLITVGSFGLGAGFYGNLPNGRDLFLRHVFIAGVLSALAVLLPLPIHWDQYALLDPAFELEIGGDFPTYVARPAMCALLVLAATAILRVRAWQRRDWFWMVLLVLPLLVLKTRGPLLFAILALSIFYLVYRTRLHDRLLQGALLLVVGLGTYVVYSGNLLAMLTPYLIRDNPENAATLTGRLPLWEVLWPEVWERPWLGSGFAAFWNPDTYFWVEQLVGFPAKSAHNGFLDELLNTGIIGFIILMAFLLCTIATVIARARRGDALGWVVFMLIVFYLLVNLTTSLVQDFIQSLFIIILCGLGIMASKQASEAPTPPEVGVPAEARPSIPHRSAV